MNDATNNVTPIPSSNPPSGAGEKSKVAAGVLGILLGALGVHKFYLGWSIDKVTAQFGGYGRQELYVPDFELAATNSNWLVKRLSQLFRAGKQTRSGRKRVCWDVRRSKYVFRT